MRPEESEVVPQVTQEPTEVAGQVAGVGEMVNDQQPVVTVSPVTEQPVIVNEQNADAPQNNVDATQNTPTPQLPVKKSKKGLIIGLVVAGVALLGLAIASVVYAAVYNNPDNAVLDAFSKAITAKSGSTTGNMSYKLNEMSMGVDFSASANESQQSSSSITFKINTDGKEHVVKGNFVSTKDEVYIKLEDLKSVFAGVLGSEYSDMIDLYFGTLINKIDNKWVVIKPGDLKELSDDTIDDKETQCIQGAFAKLQTDKVLRGEMEDTYRKHPLLVVTSKGSDKDGNRYSLALADSDTVDKFVKASVETKFFKSVDDCVKTDLKKEFSARQSSSSNSSDKTAITFEVWVDGWSHNLNKISFGIKNEEGELSSDFRMKFNNNPVITIPKADTTVDDLKTEIKRLQSQLASPSYDSSSSLYDDSVYDDLDSGYSY